MSTRITNEHLQAIVDRLNVTTDSPMTPYSQGPDGKHRANPGNYHLSFAYGGVALHRMVGESGGVSEPLRTGHISKRELAELLYAYLYGINDGLDLAEKREAA